MFDIQDKGDSILVNIKGEVNAQSGLELKNKVLDSFKNKSTAILSFKGVIYINSSGLREIIDLLKIGRKEKKNLKLCSMSDDIREMFAFTGLDKVFKIYDNEAQALG